MVHITDTRAQKVFCCTSAHITETVLAHDQHYIGERKQACLLCIFVPPPSVPFH